MTYCPTPYRRDTVRATVVDLLEDLDEGSSIEYDIDSIVDVLLSNDIDDPRDMDPGDFDKLADAARRKAALLHWPVLQQMDRVAMWRKF